VTRDEIINVRIRVVDNYLAYTALYPGIGPCGAVSYALSKMGWGRIAECWYGRGDKAEFEKLDTDQRYDKGWQQHYVLVNKFVGIIDASGAYLCHPTLASKPHYLELEITDRIEPGDRFLWPKRALNFWNKALQSRSRKEEVDHLLRLFQKEDSTHEEIRDYISSLPTENTKIFLTKLVDDILSDARAAAEPAGVEP